MSSFPSSFSNLYIFLAIFDKFEIPKVTISDHDTLFCNHLMEALLRKYHVVHRTSTTYHPQSNG